MASRQNTPARPSGSTDVQTASPAPTETRLATAGEQISAAFAVIPDVSVSFTMVEETRMLSARFSGEITSHHRCLVNVIATTNRLSIEWSGDEAVLTG